MKTAPQKRRLSGFIGDAAWEASKAATRNLSHAHAVQESDYLTMQYRRMWRHQGMQSVVSLDEILRTLTQKKIPFVLTGAYGMSGWRGQPRSTHDVDILVKGGRNHARAVNAMKALYPQLEVSAHPGLTAFFVPGEDYSVIDVVYPHRADIAETLAHPVWVDDQERGLRYRIPSLEAALANKYGAMVTLSRDSKKRRLDIIDFEWMIVHSQKEGRQPIDLTKLEFLGEKVWPGGGGKEILRLVERIKAGGFISLENLTGNLN